MTTTQYTYFYAYDSPPSLSRNRDQQNDVSYKNRKEKKRKG